MNLHCREPDPIIDPRAGYLVAGQGAFREPDNHVRNKLIESHRELRWQGQNGFSLAVGWFSASPKKRLPTWRRCQRQSRNKPATNTTSKSRAESNYEMTELLLGSAYQRKDLGSYVRLVKVEAQNGPGLHFSVRILFE
jgi:hypothetical protein